MRYLGHNAIISSIPSEIENADTLILPGVGSFRKAMLSLQASHLDEAILEAVAGKGCKIMGICLGMQLLALSSTEDGHTCGLGLIPLEVKRFDVDEIGNLKVPHVGFNQVQSHDKSIIFSGIAQLSDFYFVHSYRLLANEISGHHGLCHYGQNFLAAYEHENVFATQFHPEKSQTNGLKLLKNFLEY